MADPISPQISERICSHMNDDHAGAIALYAQVYGATPEAESAKMLSIDPHGMNLNATVKGSEIPIRIEFDHVLQDSEDAHHTLIDMAKQARQKKG